MRALLFPRSAYATVSGVCVRSYSREAHTQHWQQSLASACAVVPKQRIRCCPWRVRALLFPRGAYAAVPGECVRSYSRVAHTLQSLASACALVPEKRIRYCPWQVRALLFPSSAYATVPGECVRYREAKDHLVNISDLNR